MGKILGNSLEMVGECSYFYLGKGSLKEGMGLVGSGGRGQVVVEVRPALIVKGRRIRGSNCSLELSPNKNQFTIERVYDNMGSEIG